MLAETDAGGFHLISFVLYHQPCVHILHSSVIIGIETVFIYV